MSNFLEKANFSSVFCCNFHYKSWNFCTKLVLFLIEWFFLVFPRHSVIHFMKAPIQLMMSFPLYLLFPLHIQKFRSNNNEFSNIFMFHHFLSSRNANTLIFTWIFLRSAQFSFSTHSSFRCGKFNSMLFGIKCPLFCKRVSSPYKFIGSWFTLPKLAKLETFSESFSFSFSIHYIYSGNSLIVLVNDVIAKIYVFY
jgi:hypothetical protein